MSARDNQQNFVLYFCFKIGFCPISAMSMWRQTVKSIRGIADLRGKSVEYRPLGSNPHAVPPVPTQAVIFDRKFSRGSLDRCADRRALDMIAVLTSPGPRAL